MKNYISCALFAALFFSHRIAISQTKELKSEVDLHGTSYSTLALANGDSTSIVNWIKHTASLELNYCDSIFKNYKIINVPIKKQLLKAEIYSRFISEDWDGAISFINNYKIAADTTFYWTKSNFVQVLSYAESKKRPVTEFDTNYLTSFYRTLDYLKQSDKERLATNIFAQLEDSRDTFNERIKKTSADKIISGNDLSELLEAYVNSKISGAIIKPLGRTVQRTQNERYFVDAHLRIPLKNGLKLGGILVLPKNIARPLPAILVISCYAEGEKLREEIAQTKKIADHGFAGLMVFSRGKAESEGIFYPGETEAQDNYDIIDWISHQSWCNGKVGMLGGSYAGQMQWQATVKLHPALKTIVPQAAAYNGIDVPVLNGAFQSSNLSWLQYVKTGRYDNHHGRNDEEWDKIYTTYLTKGIAFNRLDSIENGGRDSVFQRWLLHPSYDEYWRKMSPGKTEYSTINIPILTMTGYFDDEQRGAIGYYNMHQKYGPAGTSKNHYLFIGPFDHAGAQGFPSPYVSPYEIDSAALINQNDLVYQWFNYILKGNKKPAFFKDRVAVFVLGENKWHYFRDLKKMNRDTVTYFISGKDGSNPQNFQLSTTNITTPNVASLKFNTANVSDDTLNVYTGINSLVTEEIFKKKNKLIFRSETFKTDVILNGTIIADLFLTMSAPDADIMISWWEEDIGGKLWPLSQTVQRLSYSFNKSKRVLWSKGKVYHITLKNAYWMSKQLKKGSKLVMTFSPLADKQWEKNYGSGKDVSIETIRDGRPVLLKVYTSKKYPSNIQVPFM